MKDLPPWFLFIGGFLGVMLGAVLGGAQLLGGALLFGLILVFYFLPAVISNVRNTRHGWTILLINLFFGWTVLGWIAALIWAIVEAPEQSLRPWSDKPIPAEPVKKYETVYHPPES